MRQQAVLGKNIFGPEMLIALIDKSGSRWKRGVYFFDRRLLAWAVAGNWHPDVEKASEAAAKVGAKGPPPKKRWGMKLAAW